MEYTIDRFEGQLALLVGERGTLELPRTLLPATAAEGDVVRKEPEGWQVDTVATAARRRRIAEKLEKLLGGKQ